MDKAIFYELEKKETMVPLEINLMDWEIWKNKEQKSCYHRMIDNNYSNLLEAQRRHNFPE